MVRLSNMKNQIKKYKFELILLIFITLPTILIPFLQNNIDDFNKNLLSKQLESSVMGNSVLTHQIGIFHLDFARENEVYYLPFGIYINNTWKPIDFSKENINKIQLIDNVSSSYLERMQNNTKEYNDLIKEINVSLEYPPLCLWNFTCSSLISFFHIIQIVAIAVLFILYLNKEDEK